MVKLFGTDGIRGRVNTYPVTADVVVRVGMAVGIYVIQNSAHKMVVVGRDTRASGEMLECALISGLLSTGCDVMCVGIVPTPAVAVITKMCNAGMGIAISASHNPYHDNGLKFFDNGGCKLSSSAEETIHSNLRDDKMDSMLQYSGSCIGKIIKVDNACDMYVEAVQRTVFKKLDFGGKRVVFDCANGAACGIIEKVMRGLNIDLVITGNRPTGYNINLCCGSSHPGHLTDVVKESAANIGFAFDGDADRLLVCAGDGNIVDGDRLIAAIACAWHRCGRLKSNVIVTTMLSNSSLDSYFADRGLKLIRSGIGDRSVNDTMRQNNSSFGGERSGHVIFSDYNSSGDGIVTALQILDMMIYHNMESHKLADDLVLRPQLFFDICDTGQLEKKI